MFAFQEAFIAVARHDLAMPEMVPKAKRAKKSRAGERLQAAAFPTPPQEAAPAVQAFMPDNDEAEDDEVHADVEAAAKDEEAPGVDGDKEALRLVRAPKARERFWLDRIRERKPVRKCQREFAFAPPRRMHTKERSVFLDTILWSAGRETNDKGEATFTFSLSDSITTFNMRSDVFAAAPNSAVRGHLLLGRQDAEIISKAPFFLEPKLPLHMIAGDQAVVPVSIVNNLNYNVSVSIVVRSLGGAGEEN